MKTTLLVLVGGAIAWLPLQAVADQSSQETAVADLGTVVVAQGWRDKLGGFKGKGSAKPARKDEGDTDKKDLPAGDCASYPIGCGPGYTNPKLTGIDCEGRSEIGCLCWKDLATEQQCAAYRASKNKK